MQSVDMFPSKTLTVGGFHGTLVLIVGNPLSLSKAEVNSGSALNLGGSPTHKTYTYHLECLEPQAMD